MLENESNLYSAFKAKDARFDGKFVVGISSTNIYCRPVCKAKMPKEENCTPAEAEQAGYRPCLLCRPELAPGMARIDSVANLAYGTARMLEENCRNEKSLEEVAKRLGVSDRHLRRAFMTEYKVSPVEYLQTCRLLLAKNLLTDTSLSVLDVAMAAGFGSVRRFNELFKKQYTIDEKPEYYYLDSKCNAIGGYAKLTGGTEYSEPLLFKKTIRNNKGIIDGEFLVKEKLNSSPAYSNSSTYSASATALTTVSSNFTDGATAYMFSAFATLSPTTTNVAEQCITSFMNSAAALNNSRFGLRAVVNYVDGIKTEFFVSGDSKNKQKQFIALPVTIDTKRTLLNIQLYFDYLGNTGFANISDMRLTPAEWSYTKYDEFGVAKQSKSSMILLNKGDITIPAYPFLSYTYSDSVVDYENDEEHRCIKETETCILSGTISETRYAVKKYFYNDFGKIARTESYLEYDILENGQTVKKRDEESGINIAEIIYSDKGVVIKEISYNSLDSSTKFYSESETAEDGKTSADIDETGENKTTYEYADGTNIVKTATSPNGSKSGYGYDYAGNVTAITQSTEAGEGNTTSMHSNCGIVTKLTSGLHTVNYEYNGKRRKTKVELNGAEHIAYTYTDNTSVSLPNAAGTNVNTVVDKVTAKLAPAAPKTGSAATATVVETLTDKHGNMRRVSIDGAVQVTNQYESDDRLKISKDNVTNSVITNEFDTTIKQRIKKVTKSAVTNVAAVTETYGYNQYGQASSRAVTGAVNHNYTYNYKPNAARDLDYMTLPNDLRYYPQADVNGRSTGKILTDSADSNKFGEYIYYRKVGDHGTNMVSSMRYGGMKNGKYVIEDGLKYTYDNMGNITEVRENGILVAKYAYDKLNRLAREDNRKLNKSYFITYDNNGNVLSKREAPYSISTDTDNIISFTDEKLYSYDAKHGDRLVDFGGQAIEYNTAGNPLTYRGNSLEWQKGSQLKKFGNVEFVYDGYGKRIKKDDTVFTYDCGNKLIKQTDGYNTFEYYYDNSGLSGFNYKFDHPALAAEFKIDAYYIYRKNIQGDITHILDMNGNIVVKYTYDAWGNHTITDTSGFNLGKLNPFRYRSYFWDSETGLYFLQSRYYDPQIGRFISQDDVTYLNPETISGLNLYAYCGSNPVMMTDSTGQAPKWWQAILIGVGIIVGAAIIGAAIAVTAGAATPFLTIVGTSIVGGLKVAAVAGLTAGVIRTGASVVNSIQNGESFGDALVDAGKSFVTGFADGFFAGSVYAGINMIMAPIAMAISGAFNEGSGWSRGLWEGGYQTPKTPGISFGTFHGGVNGGRSFGIDLDMYHGLHLHYGKTSKIVNKHRWIFAPIMIGIGVGFSKPWSEW